MATFAGVCQGSGDLKPRLSLGLRGVATLATLFLKVVQK